MALHLILTGLVAVLLAIGSLRLGAQPASWTSVGVGGGGALFNPAISPHNINVVYMSCDMSQIFRSSTFGGSWEMIDFRQVQGSGAHGRIEFTSDPLIVYTTGRIVDNGAPFRSTDGGATWMQLASDPTGGNVWDLRSDPTRTDRILVSDYSTLYISTNGGATFRTAYEVPGGDGCRIAGAWFAGDSIYVGIGQGVLISTNGGLSFSLTSGQGIPSDQAIVSFCGAGSGDALRFYAVTLGSGDVYPGVTGADHATFQGLYTMSQGSPSWISRTSAVPSGVTPFFIGCARANSMIAYAAGGSQSNFPTVLKTTDGGATWKAVLNTMNNANVRTGWSGSQGDRDWWYGEYALGFAVCASNADRVIITDLGFPHVTSDGGATWRQAYVDSLDEHPAGAPTPKRQYYRGIGLENTTCWNLLWVDSATVIGCFSDIQGTRSNDGGTSWSFDYEGHSLNSMYHAVRHPTNGTIYAGVSSVHDLYQSTYLQDSRIDQGSGGVRSSNDGGRTWTNLHEFANPVFWLALDPGNPNRLYAAVVHSAEGGIYVSDNIDQGGASTWRRLSVPSRTEGHPMNIRVLPDGALLCSYSGRRDGAGAFTASSGVFLSTDNGVTWQDRSADQMRYWTKDVVIDPNDQAGNTWYAAVFSGWGGPPNDLGGLYRTTDRGATWAPIFDNDRVTSMTVDPENPNAAYVTTEVDGLWFTTTLQSGNPNFMQVGSFPFRQPERVFFNPYRRNEVWVTSFGNGMRRGVVSSSGVEFGDDAMDRLDLR